MRTSYSGNRKQVIIKSIQYKKSFFILLIIVRHCSQAVELIKNMQTTAEVSIRETVTDLQLCHAWLVGVCR